MKTGQFQPVSGEGYLHLFKKKWKIHLKYLPPPPPLKTRPQFGVFPIIAPP